MAKTAVLVDGGFYRKRAIALWGNKPARDRAEELNRYVFKHLDKTDGDCKRELYRVFYYDCPPIRKKVFHPKLGKTVDFGKDPMYAWATEFHDALKSKGNSPSGWGESSKAEHASSYPMTKPRSSWRERLQSTT